MMDTEKNSLEILSKESQEALENICREQGVDWGSCFEAVSKAVVAAGVALEAVSKVFDQVKDIFAEALPPIVEQFNFPLGDTSIDWESELFWMVPPHVRHLAHNHPKARVRVKNWNRMWKIRERYMKCHKQ